MNTQAHWLSAFAAITHLTIGMSELTRIGPRFLPPSWQVIYMVLPDGFDWTYPWLWAMTGVMFMAGIVSPRVLRLGFRLSALLFLSWGLAGIPAMALGLGSNIPGTVANIFTAGGMWVLSHYVRLGVQGDATNAQVVRLAEQLRQDPHSDHGQ